MNEPWWYDGVDDAWYTATEPPVRLPNEWAERRLAKG